MNNRNFFQRFLSEIIMFFILLIMMGWVLFSSWGILLLDYVATPSWNINFLQHGWFLFPQIPVSVFGFEFGTKWVFFTILILAYYLGVFLVRGISQKFSFQKSIIAEIFLGIFFMINPFAYERMMVQPMIYLGVILLGWVVYFLFFSENRHKYLISGLLSGLAINIFLHASFMVALIFLVHIAFFVRKKQEFVQIFLAGIIAIFVNLNWILAPFFGITNSTSYISTFSAANFEAFMTQALAPMNVWFTNIFLYGFWGERFANHYASVQFLSSLWFVAGAFLFILAIFGAYILFFQKNQKKFFSTFFLIFLFSLVFGIGIASPMLQKMTFWMAENIPFWAGYREPQKWIGLVMIIEAIFLSVWLLWFFEKFQKDVIVKISAIITIFLLFVTWSPGAFWNYQGQLRTTVFPSEYENFRTQKIVENFSGKILALPWHSYLGCAWTGRPTISNPISGLLSPLHVTVANNIEVGPILYSNYSDERTKNIEKFVKEKDFSAFQKTDLTHIFLMKNCASSETFSWLDTLPQCQKIDDNSELSFYQCQK